MTDTITSKNIDLSSWDTLYIHKVPPDRNLHIQTYCLIVGKFCYHMSLAYGVLPLVSLTYTRWQIVKKLININL